MTQFTIVCPGCNGTGQYSFYDDDDHTCWAICVACEGTGQCSGEIVRTEGPLHGDHAGVLGMIRRLMAIEISRLEDSLAEAEGGNLSEVYMGALAHVTQALDSVNDAIVTLAPETTS